MAITLDGTNGITTPDITSSGALGVDASAPDNSLVVDSSGNVGIGTSTADGQVHIKAASGLGAPLTLSTTDAGANTQVVFKGSRTYQIGTGNASSGFAGSLFFYDGTAGSERARIDSSGNLLVGTTTNADFSASLKFYTVSTYYAGAFKTTGGAAYSPIASWNTASSGTIYLNIFLVGAGTGVGSITSNGSSTSYNTTSDYRLKENVVGVTGAAARVQQLNPVRFNFIADPDKTVDGFLAHEVQDVVPEAIVGTKDAVDAEGNPVYQGIDQSKLVPLLTAALQEALTKIETLEARVAALEAA